jgi:hypothetical protein
MTTTLSIIKATIRWKEEPTTKKMTLNTDKVMFAIKQAEWEGKEDEHPLDDEIFFWLDPKEANELRAGYDMGDWKIVSVNSRREITVYPPEMTQYLDQLKDNVKKKQLLIKELETMVKEGAPHVSTNN